MTGINSSELHKQIEMFNRMQNKKRQALLAFIYTAPKTYSELMEFSKMKPGSLYHHLNVLIPLVEKKGHGLYEITELGEKIILEMRLQMPVDTKPSITKIESDVHQIDENNGDESTTSTIEKETYMQSEQEIIKNTHNSEKARTIKMKNRHTSIDIEDDPLSQLWLGNPSYFVVAIVIFISFLLAFKGVALAGSAIYSVGDLAFLFDIISVFLGIGIMYYMEIGIFRNSTYNRLEYITVIRVMSMLPATIIGITILILTSSGVYIPRDIYPWLFSLSIFFGTAFAATGINFLRCTGISRALIIASIPSFIDLFLGVIILLIQM